MPRWFRQILGLACCEEFTQWETKEAAFERLPVAAFEFLSAKANGKIEFTKRWQERSCTICGKIQQRDLRW